MVSPFASILSALTFFVAMPLTMGQPQCSAPRAQHLCCRSLNPYRDNSYVWQNVCGFPGVSDTSILVGGSCSDIPCVYDGLYDVCCEGFLPCPSSTDGAIGLNCTGNLVLCEGANCEEIPDPNPA